MVVDWIGTLIGLDEACDEHGNLQSHGIIDQLNDS